ncbi:GNAT family N-acetyltransferase [Pontiella sulfatireligans]|uniref:Acetyltransferase YpeA n=1 Tax=Pontiella sulfatireligans TaxID=2750658 RepID=A0A6C2US13_9BACT|nr:GNAT family N-acetyltransferase [Pontiella sulfatireligans]VGO22017.1 Acetyltransferase YpeA [Pontiella sulfatireligans]
MTSTQRSNVVIRRVGLKMTDALLALEAACFDIDRTNRRNMRYLLTSPSVMCTGVFREGELVGAMVMLFRSNAAVARIYSLAVVPEFRGQGIGRKLLATAERKARARGCTRMKLEVRMDNIPAIRLYESLGYVDTEVRPEYYEDRAAAFIFRKALD